MTIVLFVCFRSFLFFSKILPDYTLQAESPMAIIFELWKFASHDPESLEPEVGLIFLPREREHDKAAP